LGAAKPAAVPAPSLSQLLFTLTASPVPALPATVVTRPVTACSLRSSE